MPPMLPLKAMLRLVACVQLVMSNVTASPTSTAFRVKSVDEMFVIQDLNLNSQGSSGMEFVVQAVTVAV